MKSSFFPFVSDHKKVYQKIVFFSLLVEKPWITFLGRVRGTLPFISLCIQTTPSNENHRTCQLHAIVWKVSSEALPCLLPDGYRCELDPAENLLVRPAERLADRLCVPCPQRWRRTMSRPACPPPSPSSACGWSSCPSRPSPSQRSAPSRRRPCSPTASRPRRRPGRPRHRRPPISCSATPTTWTTRR